VRQGLCGVPGARAGEVRRGACERELCGAAQHPRGHLQVAGVGAQEQGGAGAPHQLRLQSSLLSLQVLEGP